MQRRRVHDSGIEGGAFAALRFLLVLLALAPARLTAGLAPPDDAGRKPIATRADLESALTQAEQIAASDGYSADSAIRNGPKRP